MKRMKWSVLSALCLCVLLFSQGDVASQDTLPPPNVGDVPTVPTPGCGSVWKGARFDADAVWTVPEGVEIVWVTGVGGGGGGSNGAKSLKETLIYPPLHL